MKRLIITIILAFGLMGCSLSINANEMSDYEEFLEYKKFKENKAKDSTYNLDKKDSKQKIEVNKQNSNTLKTLDSSDIAKLKSGGFIGVNLGGGLINNVNISTNQVNNINNQRNRNQRDIVIATSHFALGINGGYIHFFNPYIGIRGFGEIGIGYGIGQKDNDGNIISGGII
ncbi:hypothetical protein [Helicobacter sp. MIT 14-3879]|uniref:hypothetical protein n=1 Tax=Helicobacter sp. MIT 14-3879 TaxID=2040649 RepID=UPI000E1E3430|nr:hypothetical protein [Helicobacter sp. MIT 14-3879]RDU65467.1 hypothetical protein CQA44_00290 [Helicobacter sp. MIT 14-3879]